MLYWLSINHMERIKTYGLVPHFKYVFNFNVSRVVVNLQANLADLPPLITPEGYMVRQMETTDKKEIAIWIRIVNNAYPDADENEESFMKHLYKHPFLEAQKIFFLIRDQVIVGTVTTGRYRKNPEYGGDARIAILPTEQGKGLGFFAINYAFHYIKNQGISKGETVISLRRTPSLLLHFKCGFRPEFDRSKLMFDVQKRMWPVRMIVKKKVQKLFTHYLSSIQ